jgi:predicted acyl esterase
MMGRRALRAVLAAGVVASGLGIAPVGGTVAQALPAQGSSTSFQAHGSVEQVYVTHASTGDTIELHDASNATVASGTVDDLGSFLFHDVTAGDGYTVVEKHAGGDQISGPLHVMTRTEIPPQSFYANQHLTAGFQYITTRDGTKLSAEVTLPGPPEDGPYPTVIEYSGYDPSHPGHPQPSTQIAQLLPYATVGVNIRGTGCSGGAFSFFEPLQGLDGYDVVEAVAAQPWVLHGKPGMVGISYPGIAQTFTAPTQPPHLAAIAPLSVVADTYRSLAYPGGIPNTGFPREWAQERDTQALPLGQGWEQSVIDGGGAAGAQCAENQLLRHQNTKLVATFDSHPFREPVNLADELSPQLLDTKINVPVFMGGAWQDEQTGGQSSLIWQHLTLPSSKTKLFGTNGTHVDSLVAELNRWYEFLEFYVAQRIPKVPAGVRAIAPLIFQSATGIPNVQLEPDRFTKYTSYASALAAYEKEPPIRILFENGAGNASNLGAPYGTYEAHFTSWPPPNEVPTTWFFQPDQKLSSTAPTIADDAGNASTSYVYDPAAKPLTDFHGSTSDIWGAHPAFDWRALPLGKALAFDSPPLTKTTVVAGPGSVDLWLRSSDTDTDLEVTVSELRPDGKEIYVQNGWLRASQRKLDAANSTVLQPAHTYTSEDAEPLPAGEFVSARVPLFPFAHIFRAGSRLRISVEAPGGNRPFWSFDDRPGGHTINEIAHSVGHPSKIVLPVIPGLTGIPPKLPPCGSVRGEPCRNIVSNGAPTGVAAAPNGSSAVVSWKAPSARSGDALKDFVISSSDGAKTTVGPKTTLTQIDNLDPGVHHFVVTAVFTSGGAVASTGSNDVTTDTTPPTTSTTTSTTSTSTTSTTTPVAPAGATTTTTAAVVVAPSASGGTGGSLPFTGSETTVLVLAGGLMVFGGAMLRARKRRGTLP